MRKPGSGPVDRRCTSAEPRRALEHTDRHAGACEVAGDDRAVMSSTEHDRVVPLVSHRRSLSRRGLSRRRV